MSQYYGGLGPMTNAVLWVEVVVFFVFVALRIYTRKVILNSVGPDDYLVLLALVLQIIYTALVHVASNYGLGRLFADVGDMEVYFTAVKWEVFSQVAGILVIGVGKCAVGIFLLRIVRSKIQIGFIWAFIAGTVFITLFAAITVVARCTPVEKSWNDNVPGHCAFNFSPIGMTVGCWFVIADFAFAILPWFVVWGLNMKRKEKITVACGLSLGVFAGVCGIVRTVALNGLNAQEYIYDTVPMLIWSATESTVTIMCSSIPVLRPLYVRFRYGSKGDSSSGGGGGNSSYKLPMYGNNSAARNKYGNNSAARNKYGLSSTAAAEPGVKAGPTHHAHAVATYSGDNASDESILRDAKAQGIIGGGIRRTDEVSISYGAYAK